MTIERRAFDPPVIAPIRMPAAFPPPNVGTVKRRERQAEARHENHLLEIERATRETAAALASKSIIRRAVLNARQHELGDAKFAMLRNSLESQLFGGDNPELRAEFAVLDDDFFRSTRHSLMEW